MSALRWITASLLLACSTPAAQPSTPTLATPQVSGAEQPPPAEMPVLRVATSGDYAPFSKDGAGFDIAVAQRMARDLAFRIAWVGFRWPELQANAESGAFDIAMSGITWRPDRAVVGFMTRAVASGGPCLLGDAAPRTVAVNRGGILERWARGRFADDQIRTVDNNLSLPRLLQAGEVDAIVTDSFELPHFAVPGKAAHCEPARDRKVYWISHSRADDLAPRVEQWLADNEAYLASQRAKFLGQAIEWTPRQHLVDLLARRLSLMPAVAAYKRDNGVPIEDLEREAVVLDKAVGSARAAGLNADSVRALFAEQIELAKAIQRRTGADAEAMPLDEVLRPALLRLGERILTALTQCADELPALQLEELDLLTPLLTDQERQRLLLALRAVRPSPD